MIDGAFCHYPAFHAELHQPNINWNVSAILRLMATFRAWLTTPRQLYSPLFFTKCMASHLQIVSQSNPSASSKSTSFFFKFCDLWESVFRSVVQNSTLTRSKSGVAIRELLLTMTTGCVSSTVKSKVQISHCFIRLFRGAAASVLKVALGFVGVTIVEIAGWMLWQRSGDLARLQQHRLILARDHDDLSRKRLVQHFVQRVFGFADSKRLHLPNFMVVGYFSKKTFVMLTDLQTPFTMRRSL